MSPSGKATDFDSVISLVRIQPSQPIYKLQFCFRIVLIYLNYEPLAQLAEHLTFNQGVRGSNPRWLTKTVNPNLSRLAMGSDLLFLQFEKGEKSRLKDSAARSQTKEPCRAFSLLFQVLKSSGNNTTPVGIKNNLALSFLSGSNLLSSES